MVEWARPMSMNYTFQIDAYTPATIPMVRLAKYMLHYADMFGHDDAVHFKMLGAGSLRLVANIDDGFSPKVAKRLALIDAGEGDSRGAKAKAAIGRLLAEDGTSGFIFQDGDDTDKIISFPRTPHPLQEIIGPICEEHSIDGTLIKVGGAGQTASLQLQCGRKKYTKIRTSRDIARRIAKQLYEPVRLFGRCEWIRNENGRWIMQKFQAEKFIVLENIGLKETFHRLRAIEGSDWKKMDDPIQVAMALRDKSAEVL